MYESPITKIYGQIQSEIIKQDEEHLMYSVNQSVGYQVDRDELIKALRRDREQYLKGYFDCKIEMINKVKKAREEMGQLKHKNTDVEGYRWWNNAIENCLHELDKLIESEAEE